MWRVWHEGIGGAVTLLCLAGFCGWNAVLNGRLPAEPYFVLVAAPGAIFLVSWFLRPRRQWVRQGAR